MLSHTRTLAAVIVSSALLVGCTALPPRVVSTPRPSDLTLFSWKPPHQPWHFALTRIDWRVYSKWSPQQAEQFIRTSSHVVGRAAFIRQLAQYAHRGQKIEWTDSPPTLQLPPAAYSEPVELYAQSHGIELTFNPVLIE